MKTEHTIIENFLSDDMFNYFNTIICSDRFKWGLMKNPNVNSPDENQFQLKHDILDGGVDNDYTYTNLYSDFVEVFLPPIMNILKSKMGYKQCWVARAKVNLFIKQEKPVPLGFHNDIKKSDSDKFNTLLLYFDTNNGYTEFETGEKISTVANRALIFPAHAIHQTVTQSDKMFRRNININYKEIK